MGATLHFRVGTSHCGGFSCCGALALGAQASVVVAHRLSSCGARASHCGGFSCCGALALGMQASVVVGHGLSSCSSRAPERRLTSCSVRA